MSHERARSSEREAIVAWLRADANLFAGHASNYGKRELYQVAASYAQQAAFQRGVADAIEAGDHLSKPEQD